MRVLRFYLELLKGSPNHVRETWETAVYWVSAAFAVLLFANPELAGRIRDSWDGFSRWWAIGPVALAVIARVAVSNVHEFDALRKRLAVQYGPHLLPVKCQPETWQLIEVGASAPTSSCKAWVVRFNNDPERPDESAHARDVLGQITYEVDGKELVSLAAGRWGETDQPVDQLTVVPRRPIIHLETVDIKIGQSRVLAIAVRLSDGNIYAFSNESYRDGFANPKYKLSGAWDEVTVIVRLRGIGVDGRYVFAIRRMKTEPRLELVDSKPRPEVRMAW